ncbi:VOC family protein [Neobacillus bataviensis]|uniref:VOC family protein n=1 Tax=Neobacillus bataviensis TaxID=220685 RepID=UPI001CBD4CEC|nr:VOC family protein [Neobacillus bataviensis]
MKIKKIINRIYVNDLEKAVPFYEGLFQTKATRFNYWSKGLDIAALGDFLLVSGTDEALSKVPDSAICFLVEDIEAYKTWLLDNGAVIRQDITKDFSGYSMIVEQPDGMVVEYVEHSYSY